MTAFQSFDELYPGRFLKAGLFNGEPVTFTVRDIVREELQGERGVEPKVIMSFEEMPLQLVLAKINAVAIKAMFGSDPRQWVGKRVTLYGTTSIMPHPKRRNEPCIRVMGSPDLQGPVSCEWTPPRRKPIVQNLKPTQVDDVFKKAMAAIQAMPIEQLDSVDALLQARFNERKITAEQYQQLFAAKQARLGV
jgi:hypothetical protein